MIEIQDLENLKKEEVIALLLTQENPFEIYIPKETEQFFNTNESICNDYAYLAYAGQRLAAISKSFKYEQVPPTQHVSVRFEIDVDDLEKLAETLLDLSYGYVNESSDEEFNYFEIVEEFMDHVDKQLTIAACSYFIKIHNEYLHKQADNS